MSQQQTQDVFQQLAAQQKIIAKIDRVLWVLLPSMALFISALSANLNLYSLLASFVVLSVALCAVGILRLRLLAVLVALLCYVFVDNYLSHGGFSAQHLGLQLLAMLLFTSIVGLGRPYMDRWLTRVML